MLSATGRKSWRIGETEESQNGTQRNNRMEKREERMKHRDSVKSSTIFNCQTRERKEKIGRDHCYYLEKLRFKKLSEP